MHLFIERDVGKTKHGFDFSTTPNKKRKKDNKPRTARFLKRRTII